MGEPDWLAELSGAAAALVDAAVADAAGGRRSSAHAAEADTFDGLLGWSDDVADVVVCTVGGIE